MENALDLPVAELAAAVKKGDVSATELARGALERIRAKSSLDAFLHVSEEPVLKAAADLDRRRAKGEALGALAGVPIAIKDALCTTDAPTTCASRILTRVGDGNTAGTDPEHGFRPPYDATVVARLRAADAILIGKANMDE